MAVAERAAGPGLQVFLEPRGRRFVWKLNRDDHPPRPMALRVAAWSRVVPVESITDVDGAPDVVAIGLALASQDVDESRSDALHLGGNGIYRAKAFVWKY